MVPLRVFRVLVHLVHVAVDAQAVALAGVGVHHVGPEDVVGGVPVRVGLQSAEEHGDADFGVPRREAGRGEDQGHRRVGVFLVRRGLRRGFGRGIRCRFGRRLRRGFGRRLGRRFRGRRRHRKARPRRGQLRAFGGGDAGLKGVVAGRTVRGNAPGAHLGVLVHLPHVAVHAQAVAPGLVLAFVGIPVLRVHHVGPEDVVLGCGVGVGLQAAETHGDGDGRALLHGGGGEADRHRRRRLGLGLVSQWDAGENDEREGSQGGKNGKGQFAFHGANLTLGSCKGWMAGRDVARKAKGNRPVCPYAFRTGAPGKRNYGGGGRCEGREQPGLGDYPVTIFVGGGGGGRSIALVEARAPGGGYRRGAL